MKFTNQCVAAFKKAIRRLFERFNDLNGVIDIKNWKNCQGKQERKNQKSTKKGNSLNQN